MLNYQLFPRSVSITSEIQNVIDCFASEYEKIDSSKNNLKSDDVLHIVSHNLKKLGFSVESGKLTEQKINVPVLFAIRV